jgi:hypothetical protein
MAVQKMQRRKDKKMRKKEFKCDCGKKCVTLSIIDYGSFYEFVLWLNEREKKDGFHAILLSQKQIKQIRKFLEESLK